MSLATGFQSNVMEGIGNHGPMMESHGQILEYGLKLADKWSRFPTKYRNGKSTIKGYEKWESVDFIQGIQDPWKRSLVGHMLENAFNYYARLDETTRSLAVGNYEKYVFPIIRMTFANLVAADLVSVQPLAGPTGLVFYYDAIAGTTKGKVTKGTKLYDAKRGPERSYHYTDEVVDTEVVGSGTGSTPSFTPTLGYSPVRPGTFSMTDGTQVITDDGNGNLLGDTQAGTNTINYATGAVNASFTSNPGSGVAITATYEYNSEAFNAIPEMEIQLTSTPVVTRPNKLITRPDRLALSL